MIDVLVLNYNDSETTIRFVKSIEDYSCVSHILVVDNYSTDDSLKKLKGIENDKIIVVSSNKNGGYGFGNNYGIRHLCKYYDSEYILLSNPDVIVSEEAMMATEDFLRNHDSYAMAAPFMCDNRGIRQYNAATKIPKTKLIQILSQSLILSKLFRFRLYNFDTNDLKKDCIDVDCLSGSCFMFNAKKMIDYGMYDENIFLYAEELVLGLKFRKARQKIAILPKHHFIHNHSVSINKSYKTLCSKKKVSIKSHLVVLKEYYKANKFEMCIALIVAKISVIEVLLLSLLKK